MLRKIKNFLLPICKKKLLLGVSFFILLGTLIPRISYAGIAARIGVALVVSILYLGSTIVLFMLKITEAILAWVMSPNFMGSLGYTNPATNPVIQTGLNVTQGFVNMLLVLVLVFIAIATILRIAGYETRKLLITFIIVALLVNFTPVICGVVVDSSNIIMTFFLGRISEGGFGDELRTQVDALRGDLLDADDLGEVGQGAGQTIFLLILISILSLILLIFAAVFMFRYLAIWMLVILSPLAFAAYILPKTRKYFEAWWKQLINWSFIGVTCGFFLYLSILLIRNISAIPVPDAGETAEFNRALPYMVSSAFLAMGLLVGLKTSDMGSSTIINAVKRRTVGATKRASRISGRLARRVGVGTARKVGRGIRPMVERTGRRWAAKTARGARRLGNWGLPGEKRIKPLAGFKWLMPQAVSDFGNLRPAIEAAEKSVAKESGFETADKILTQKMKGPQGMGALRKLLKTNDAQDLFKGAKGFSRWQKKDKHNRYIKDKNGKRVGFTDEELLKDKGFGNIIAPLLKSAAETGMLSSTLRRDPRLAKIAATHNLRGYKGLSPQRAVAKATAEARSEISDWEPEELNDKDVTGSVMAKFDRDRLLQINRQVKDGRPVMLETMDKEFSKFARNHSTIKESGFNEEEIAKILSDRVDKKGNAIKSETFKELWKDYGKHIDKTYGGSQYFTAVKEDRMRKSGFREAEFVSSDLKTKEEVKKIRGLKKPLTIWGRSKRKDMEKKAKEKKEKGKNKPKTIFNKNK